MFDIETNGLQDTATVVHCLAWADVDLDTLTAGPATLIEGMDAIIAWLDLNPAAQCWAGHNILNFDVPVLTKLTRRGLKAASYMDTFVMAALFWPDMDGGHSLEAWGKRLKRPKDDYQDRKVAEMLAANPGMKKEEATRLIWAVYEPEMGLYCKQDVVTNCELLIHLHKERTQTGWDWERAIAIEQAFAMEFARQGSTGVYVHQDKLDANLAYLDSELSRIELEVEPQLPMKEANKGELDELTPPKIQFKKDGTPSANAEKWFDTIAYTDGLGTEVPRTDPAGMWVGTKWGESFVLPTPHRDITNAKGKPDIERLPLKTQVQMRLKDQQAFKLWLMDMGWVPTWWNYKKVEDKRGKLRIARGDDGEPIPTFPKLHDKGELCPDLQRLINSGTVPDNVNLAVRWVILRHRRGLLASVKENIRPDGRVRADGITPGTPTARVVHRVVANFPKAEDEVLYGKECREVLGVAEGRVMVGVDASGLELRKLAHRVGNPDFNNTIIYGTKEAGTEIHTLLHKACDPLVPSRSVQKNVTYGWLYGAGDPKLGQTAGHPAAKAKAVGAEIRSRMVKAIPGLEKLMENCEAAGKRGWLKGMDGRKIEIRSKHAVLNTLLQSDGSICVKYATIYMMHHIRARGLDARLVIHYHDEVQLDCLPEHAAEAGYLFVQGLKEAQQFFGTSCPLDGEVKYGFSWADTH